MLNEGIANALVNDKWQAIQNTYSLLKQAANQYPNKSALKFIPDPRSMLVTEEYSYQQMLDSIHQMANMLLEHDVQKSDVVTLFLPNMPENFMALAALETIAIASPISPALPANQVSQLLSINNSKLLITDVNLFNKLQSENLTSAFNKIFVLGYGGYETVKIINFDHYKNYPAHELNEPSSMEQVSALFHTSGTTGTLKLAQLQQKGLIYSAWAVAKLCGYNEKDIILGALPYFHVGAPMVAGYAAFLTGATVLIVSPSGWMDPTLTHHFWQLVSHFKITSFAALAFTFAQITKNYSAEWDTSSLRHALSGTPVNSVDYDLFYQLTHIPPQEIYGFTESSCLVSGTLLGSDSQKGTMGKPCPNTQIKILKIDEQGQYERECHLNEVGMICVSGPGIIHAYVMSEAENNRRFPLTGWINTEDMGRFDGKYYHFVARKIDLIAQNCNGSVVYQDPKTIEQFLLSQPAINQAVIIGKPSADPLHEIPIAFISFNPGKTIDISALQRSLNAQFSSQALCPVNIVVQPSLPTNGMGKILKFLLKDNLSTDLNLCRPML